MARLGRDALRNIGGAASVPGYDPAAHGAGIVHLGVGAFHRAHQAVMTDDALAAAGGDWRIIGVSLRSRQIADCLNAQDGLYTVIERGAAGTTARIVGSIQRVIAADPEGTLDALSDPAIRVVTLSVTEKGYGIDLATGAPDRANPVVVADLDRPNAPHGVLGLLVAALARRRGAGHPPLTLLSCDNLPANGALLRGGVLGFASEAYTDDLADWIAARIAFPSSMVDRITPASTPATRAEAARQTGYEDDAAVETEPFSQWVIEDRFASGRPQWEAGGALFVSDVEPYERMKLTMLNGAHSMLAYVGHLVGCAHVRDVMADADLSALVRRHLGAAGGLVPPLAKIDTHAYADDLAARFANPAIAHETYQIATDGSQKMPQRIFAPALAALGAGRDIRPFAFAAAAWMRFCQGELDDGTSYEIKDPRADALRAATRGAASNAATIVANMHRLPDLVPEVLGRDGTWRGAVEDALASFLGLGCKAAVASEAARIGAAHDRA